MRKKGTAGAIILSLALVATRAAADPADELCRFEAGGRDPFARWMTSQEVVCSSHDALEFPPGVWNVFARSGDGISAEPISITVDENGSASAPLPALVPAATLHVELPPGHTAVVYATRHAVAFPVQERTMVPAGEELWLVVLADSHPAGVVVVPPLAASFERSIDARDGGAPAVLAWLQMSDADRAALVKAAGASHPLIRYESNGRDYAVGTLPPPHRLHEALVLAQGLPAGDAELHVGGRGWLPLRQRIGVDPQPVTLVRSPIPLRASATLAIEWNTASDLPKLDASLGSCEPADPASFALTISSCGPAEGDEEASARECTEIHHELLDVAATVGSVTLDEVPPGVYRAELRFGKLPPSSITTSLAPLQQSPVSLRAWYYPAHGSLTHGGVPLGDDAKISFAGSGVGFASADSDEYFGVLNGEVETDAIIDVETCEGERAFVLADHPLVPFRRFNIDIPDNRLTIRVVDTFTRLALDKATLRYRILSRAMPRRVVVSGVLNPDDAEEPGRFVMEALPERELELEVRHPGYLKRTVPSFSMRKSEQKDIEVQLVPVRGSQGKIDSARAFEEAAIFWHTPDAIQTERADLEPDGTFFFERSHRADETMTIVSVSHPLWITRAPVVEGRRPLQVRFPDSAPVVAIDMTDNPNAIPHLTIGGLRVPPALLRLHVRLRNLEIPPSAIPGIAATGRIEAGPQP